MLPAAVDKTQDNAAKLTSSSSSIPDSFEQQQRLLHKLEVTVVEDTPVIKVLRYNIYYYGCIIVICDFFFSSII